MWVTLLMLALPASNPERINESMTNFCLSTCWIEDMLHHCQDCKLNLAQELIPFQQANAQERCHKH